MFRFAPNPVDRVKAMNLLLTGNPSETALQEVVKALREDTSAYPVFGSTSALGRMKREDFRPFFRGEMAHANSGRRADAIHAMGALAKASADMTMLRAMVDVQQPYAVVIAAVGALKTWDAQANRDVFDKALAGAGDNLALRLAAYDALAKVREDAGDKADPYPEATKAMNQFLSDLANGVQDTPTMTPSLRRFLFPNFVRGTARYMSEMRSLTFLAREDVDLETRGSHITRVLYYKLVSRQGSMFWVFRVTGEGTVGDVDIYPVP